jgi:tyrosyl-tRNA synthetase
MSKSLGNYIGIGEPAREMYGKTMSIPDSLIVRYAGLAAEMPPWAVEAIERGLRDGSLHPREAKAEVAKSLVTLYHGERAADEAAGEFDRIFREKGLPDDIEVFAVGDVPLSGEGTIDLARLIRDSGGAKSLSEARRLIRQGGVSLDGQVVRDEQRIVRMDQEHLLKVGKRFFRRIRKGSSTTKNA